MKKLLFFSFLLQFVINSFAQTPFFEQTSFRGAFAPAPNAMWTDNWTNWDPQNTAYPAPTVTISSNITSNTTWTANNTYLLQGQIYVKNGSTLTIEPGTIILGDAASVGAGLFITKGSKLMAEGTSSNPIVFTSSQDVGSRNVGDWGGIILLGKGNNNNPGGIGNVEGIAPSSDTEYGGGTSPDDNDNSGSLKYVRIEYSGYVYAPNKEINGLTFGAVGKGTTIDYVQVSFGNDDGFEWFGGTVNCKHLVSYRNLDDDFDTDNGYSGLVQFALSVRDPDVSDDPAVSTSEGFESDNNPSGDNTAPFTSAIFSNVTLIGPFRGNTSTSVANGYRRGARIRRNSHLKIYNSLFMDHVRGVHIDGSSCSNNAKQDDLSFKYNIIAGTSTGKVCERTSGDTVTFNITNWFAQSMNDSLTSTNGILVTPYNYNSPDYRPASSSPALQGANFTDAIIAAVTGVAELNKLALTKSGIFPNPANNHATLSIEVATSKQVCIKTINSAGVLVASSTHLLNAGNNTFSMPTEAFSNGIYFILIESNDSQEALKWMINK